MKTYSRKQFLAALSMFSLAGVSMAQADRAPSAAPQPGDQLAQDSDRQAAAKAAAGQGVDSPPGAELSVHKGEGELRFLVSGHGSTPGKQLGAVLVSLSSEQIHFLNGLPPLLGRSQVLAFGAAQPAFEWKMPLAAKGMPSFYAQGVLADEHGNVHASAVRNIDLTPRNNEQGVKMES